jgi:hypothetical protein
MLPSVRSTARPSITTLGRVLRQPLLTDSVNELWSPIPRVLNCTTNHSRLRSHSLRYIWKLWRWFCFTYLIFHQLDGLLLFLLAYSRCEDLLYFPRWMFFLLYHDLMLSSWLFNRFNWVRTTYGHWRVLRRPSLSFRYLRLHLDLRVRKNENALILLMINRFLGHFWLLSLRI